MFHYSELYSQSALCVIMHWNVLECQSVSLSDEEEVACGLSNRLNNNRATLQEKGGIKKRTFLGHSPSYSLNIT